MSTPKSVDAYKDCEDHFERALASPKGIALVLATNAEATRFVQRANAFRVLLRQRAKQIYPQDHPLYGLSPYDKLKVARDPENDCRILIKSYDQTVVSVEEL